MEQKPKRNELDVNFRRFLLGIMKERSLTSSDIKRLMQADYPEKRLSRQRLNQIIHSLTRAGLVSRKEIEGDYCKFTYTITKFGKQRLDYYQSTKED